MMRVWIQRMGRLLLSLPFILGGFDAVREPGPRAAEAASAGLPLPEVAVRVNGIVMIAAGIGLAFGRLPRRAAAILSMVLVPTTLAGHAFWKETSPQKRAGQLTHFVKTWR